ncbi:MAG: OprD family porin [Pseudomonas sp.]|uniref:OprD family porin n=1 Tax=Pseudomonas sp. TaxID=306 RepID=UPI002734F6EF|nr:OprD family porin [Pseudomonas sp.]MDP3844947.1 OprD family porin [Pseudomonas sp.]
MQMMKWSVMALAIAAATTQLAVASSQSDSKGFVEDSTLDLLSRNFAFQRDFKNNAPGKNMTNEWAQGEMLTYSSGFTQGTVGFGVDAFGYLGLKLNSGKGTSGTGLLSLDDDDGRAHDEYAKASGAVKLRVSETVLKYGDQRTAAPVFATSDSRLLPETATGFNVMSEEISGLVAEAGHFTAYSNRNETNFDDDLATNYSGATADSISYFGATYGVTDELSTSFYASEVEDNWRQYYANVNYAVELADDQKLAVDFNIYRTNEYGDARSGEIGNTTFSLAPSYTLGAHKFTVAYQQVRGDTPFDYVGGDSIFVANSVQYGDFNAAGEKSYQARYDIDMTSFGVPGLSFMTRYVRGSEMDNSHDNSGVYTGTPGSSKGGKEWEQNFEAKYVVQDGVAKDLSLRLREAVYRGNEQANGVYGPDVNEVRLIAEYPLSIL